MGLRRVPASPAAEVLFAFAGLGVRCFGGPVAHLGYFRAEFVQRRGWLDERQFADIVGLCQFLPGPASSQAGVAIGLHRGGTLGGLAAWVGFTLPSALLMLAFSFVARRIDAEPLGAGLLHGLQLAAVAIVAQAAWGMARVLCPDLGRAAIAGAAGCLVLAAPASAGQILAIGLGATAGLLLPRTAKREVATMPEWSAPPVSPRAAWACLALFAVLLLGLPLGNDVAVLRRFDAFYRAGAVVFGGGHVVLPLLHDAVVIPGWVSEDRFLAGYGAAQALPGPLFSFAAYLGAVMSAPRDRALGAAIALAGIFLPGMLLLAGVLPFWHGLRRRPWTQAAMRGANAATVGILAAALYDPLWTGAVHSSAAALVALVGVLLLMVGKRPAWLVVAFAGLAGTCLAS